MTIATLLQNLPERASAILGDRSVLCRELRQASQNDRLLELAEELAAVRQDRKLIERVFSEDVVTRETIHVLQGLESAQRAAAKLRTDENAVSEIAQAIKAFDSAWATTGPEPIVAGGELAVDRSRVEKEMDKATEPRTPLGYWIVHDLLDRWLNPLDNSDPAGRLGDLHATTPILGASDFTEDGAVFWLTVELFRCAGGGPFCPDPWFLGLTSITSGAAAFIHAMDEVWQLSTLGRWFRGRWRVTFQHPLEQTRDYQPNDLASFRCLQGRSAQIATLVALLAASGDPYRNNANQEPMGASEPLASDVGITASIDSQEPARPLLELTVAPVSSLPHKLDAAKRLLDTVVLADQQQLNASIEKMKDEAHAAKEKRQVFAGLHIEEIRTLGEALDLALVTNRHLAGYQDEVRERWLCQWEFDDEGNATGKADFDKAEWTPELAEKAREKFPRRFS